MKIQTQIFLLSFFLIFLSACKTTSQIDNPDVATKKDTKEDLIEKKAKKSKLLYLDANKQKILGNYEEATKLFLQCLEVNPEDAASMFELSRLYSRKGNLGEALKSAENAVKFDDTNPWYKILLAELYLDHYQYSNAVKIYSQLVKQYPDNIDYYYDWANSYIYAGKLMDAIKVYDIIEKKIGITDDISVQKKKIYLELNKIDEAAKEIQELILHYPDDPKYIAMLAELYMSNDMYEKAYDSYKKILEIDPENPFIHISLADYYRKTNNRDKAFEELKLGFENPKLDIDTKIQILLSYYTVSEFYSEFTENAFLLAEILLRVHPMEPKAYSIYSDFLVREEKYEEAREALRTVIKYDSSKYVIWDQLLRMDVELDDYESMAKTSQRAMELFPEQPLPYLFSGVSNFQLKNYDKAVKSLKRGAGFVVENDALLENFYTYLGDAYNQVKNFKESDDAYEKSLAIKPDNAYVLNNYSYYLSLRGENLDKAEKMAKKANDLNPGNASYEDTYAWVLYKLERYEEAKIWMEEALKNDGEKNPVLLEHYGDILFKLGMTEEAYEYWKKADNAGEGSEFLEKKIKDKKLYE